MDHPKRKREDDLGSQSPTQAQPQPKRRKVTSSYELISTLTPSYIKKRREEPTVSRNQDEVSSDEMADEAMDMDEPKKPMEAMDTDDDAMVDEEAPSFSHSI